MKVAVFSAKPYDRQFLLQANQNRHELVFFEPHLNADTALLARGCNAVCVFVNDNLQAQVLSVLAAQDIQSVALRCAGFNNVDLEAAQEHGMTVVRVPAYSPYAVAEHTAALILDLNRKIYRAFNRVRDGNFALDGLLGFDLHGQTLGIVGTGKVGQVVAKIMHGFGCKLLAHDLAPAAACGQWGVEYVALDELLQRADIVTLHCPLTPETHHLIDRAAFRQMRDGAMLINTSRGALVDTAAAVKALKSGKLGYLGLDVYEEEGDLFFEDLSGKVIQDDVFARLQTFPNVVITGHQAFFTRNALHNIAQTTVDNLDSIERGKPCPNLVTADFVRPAKN
ncbi:2-hydroxyacid dehydrogenase [Exilibacterium tricleocarpae]|uniref:2-hydroxyacid dehydrogenase n=1 Tax=Exilibacterium tricleocarpae TaxID=2591008 RepID=A0A545TZE6_9GAMM|nr:2-hydroxyacid dehydrogenase [Exilibacterium tricleocarpae]TQV82581.1 2-hydroxyacid dehydrogenase [Exilibacterium tricleocarpae]